MSRHVDDAMGAQRPAKITVREYWADAVEQYAQEHPADAGPLYLTLPGANGYDIQRLIDRGIVSKTETGAIHERDLHKIVAVESGSRAVLELQRRFPGLKILEMPIAELVRGSTTIRWPIGEHESFCRARVVNLDLNEPLRAEIDQGSLVIPVVRWIEKFAQLHAKSPSLNWTMCLTLHGEIHLPSQAGQMVVEFLAENFDREPFFANACKQLLGDELYDRIAERKRLQISTLGVESTTHLLMAFVPKKVIQVAHQQGWSISTVRNISYGEPPTEAPMVTWEMKFVWDTRVSSTPDTVYRECLRGIFDGKARIEKDGSVS